KARPLPACRPPSPAARGKGELLSRRLVLSLPPRSGGSCPEGAEGGALDLAVNHQDQDQKPAPFRPVGHLPPLRGGRDSHLRGDLKPVLSLPLRSGGQIGRTADLHAEGARRANAMDGVSAPAPEGLKGALLILH